MHNKAARPVRSRRLAAMALAGALGLTVAISTPAYAGYAGRTCYGSIAVYGESTSSWAKTHTDYYDQCGNLGVRAKYVSYVGGPSYWTSWKYSASGHVSVDRTNITQGGHSFSSPTATQWTS